MSNETRVNLQHLLEDLRDAYAASLEEVVITELVANALDSGADVISLEAVSKDRMFRCTDNGDGMNRAALRGYHNIAASTKTRGTGIGFAGVGAKLALLIADRVITESRSKNGARAAAEWHLKSEYRAPWKFVPFSGLIASGRGTAVSIFLHDANSPLLDPAYVRTAVIRHFYPLVAANDAIARALKPAYKKPIVILLNGEPVKVVPPDKNTRSFFVYKGKHRKIRGAGFVERASLDDNFWHRLMSRTAARPGDAGLRISTYGKVIRGGWEWLGLPVRQQEIFNGVVEVPELAEILTTNKADFLPDSASLKKYYDVRKSIQQAVLPILRELGAVVDDEKNAKTPSAFKPLSRDIEGALSLMTETFPELEPLVGEHWRRLAARAAAVGHRSRRGKRGTAADLAKEAGGSLDAAEPASKRAKRQPLEADADGDKKKTAKTPGLEISFEAFEKNDVGELGRLVEEKIVINTAHPAWARAERLGQEPYHVLLTVALTLGDYLQTQGGIRAFVSVFLKSWSEAAEKSGKLF